MLAAAVEATGVRPRIGCGAMFKTLLVPLDGSAEAAVALPPARTLPTALGAAVALFAVAAPKPPPFEREAVERTEAYLAGIAREMGRDDLPVEIAVVQGDPADCIVREAAARHADLIVMATHGRGGLRRAVLGSDSYEQPRARRRRAAAPG